MPTFTNETSEPVLFTPPAPQPDGTWPTFVVDPGATVDYPEPADAAPAKKAAKKSTAEQAASTADPTA